MSTFRKSADKNAANFANHIAKRVEDIDSKKAWHAPSFENGWSNHITSPNEVMNPAGYYKDGLGFVHLRGFITGGASNTAVMFTLPLGYRPKYTNRFPILCGTPVVGQNLEIRPNGEVYSQLGTTTGWTSIDGITFLAEDKF